MIQDQLDRAKPGDTVVVSPGTYREAVTVNVSGTADKPITIVATGVTIDATGLPFGVNGFNARYITLKGLTVVNANSGLQAHNAALRIGSNWTVEDVVVSDAIGCGIGVLGEDVTIRNTSARGCGQIGWSIGGVDKRRSRIFLTNCSAVGNNSGLAFKPPWADIQPSGYARVGVQVNGRWGAQPGWEAGGLKIMQCSDWLIEGGEWSGNGGPGVWPDWANTNGRIVGVTCDGNHGWNEARTGVGVCLEANKANNIVVDGVTCRNHNATSHGGNQRGADLAIWETSGALIRGCRFESNIPVTWRNDGVRGIPTGNTLSGNMTAKPIAVYAGNTFTNNTVGIAPAPTPTPPPGPSAVVLGGGWVFIPSAGRLEKDGKWDGQSAGVVEARYVDGVVWQKNRADTIYLFIGPFGAATQWREAAGWPIPLPPVDPRDAKIEELESRVAYLVKESADKDTMIGVLKAELAGFEIKRVTVLFQNGEEVER